MRLEDIADMASLRRAWAKVRANGGGDGGDGETPTQFAAHLDTRLAALRAALLSGGYRPGPLRSVPMRRPDGRVRLLRIPCVADRVVQTACQRRLSDGLDGRMSVGSYGYRPTRSVDQALARVRQAAAAGADWVFDADIAAFFDRVPHDRLRDDLAIWLDDARLIGLIALWLRGFGGTRGLAQGAPISPILANLFLHPLDTALASVGVPVRYADDFVVLTRDRAAAQAAQAIATATLARRGLALNPAKSRILALAQGLEFLGATLAFPQRSPAANKAGAQSHLPTLRRSCQS